MAKIYKRSFSKKRKRNVKKRKVYRHKRKYKRISKWANP